LRPAASDGGWSFLPARRGDLGDATMQHARSATVLTRLLRLGPAAAVAVVLAAGAGTPAAADEPRAYTVEVQDVTAKVGEHAVMRVTLRLRDGYRILEGYNNRVIQFSSFDDGVVFERKMVAGTVQNGTLVFAIDVRPTKPGRHPINGLFRVGYIEDPGEMSMISVPLIANVIGAE
jgi:hypothetical protein